MATPVQEPQTTPQDAASAESPTPRILHCYDLSVEALETQGMRHNNGRIFTLPFYGREIYFLLEFFKQISEGSERFVQIRKAVLSHEMLLERAEEQGF